MPDLLIKYNNKIYGANNNAFKLANLSPEIKNLADYGWSEIVNIIRSGNMPSKWIGQIKEVVGGDGNTYKVTIADNLYGRYQFVDGTYNYAVVQFLNCKPSSYQMVNGNNATFEATTIYSYCNVGGAIYNNILSDELKSIIRETKIRVNSTHTNSSSDSTKDINCYLFLPALSEVLGVRYGSYFGSVYMKETKSFIHNGNMGMFAYWANNNYADVLPLRRADTNAKVTTWLRTADQGTSNRFLTIDAAGYDNYALFSSSCYVGPCFAI